MSFLFQFYFTIIEKYLFTYKNYQKKRKTVSGKEKFLALSKIFVKRNGCIFCGSRKMPLLSLPKEWIRKNHTQYDIKELACYRCWVKKLTKNLVSVFKECTVTLRYAQMGYLNNPVTQEKSFWTPEKRQKKAKGQ